MASLSLIGIDDIDEYMLENAIDVSHCIVNLLLKNGIAITEWDCNNLLPSLYEVFILWCFCFFGVC